MMIAHVSFGWLCECPYLYEYNLASQEEIGSALQSEFEEAILKFAQTAHVSRATFQETPGVSGRTQDFKKRRRTKLQHGLGQHL